jgi:hypothetical protein
MGALTLPGVEKTRFDSQAGILEGHQANRIHDPHICIWLVHMEGECQHRRKECTIATTRHYPEGGHMLIVGGVDAEL